ncbi:N-acetyltransferase [Paenibacillus rhizovicinus]|uniref:N-acetyltransferase n=1 Tax=Paenibacillus rhizovicinus TaxID=2704463 RepID=A0A6C0P377_9BACL|nr:GNAT family N-acetyltransferase [Paenibacillus rhizovicinus]QHW32927.1 N-acetyltransferase [Paenibacillus rhizovicinus]
MNIEAVFGSFPAIQTERLNLRQLQTKDAEDLYSFWADAKVTRYLDWDGPGSVEDSGQLIESWNQAYQERRLLPWGISYRQQSELLGTITLMPTRGTFEESRYPLVMGYDLTPKQWNQGIMSEALNGVLDFTRRSLRPYRIQAEVSPENTASLKLLKKLGFQQEGVLRSYLMHEVTHKLLDIAVMALLCN